MWRLGQYNRSATNMNTYVHPTMGKFKLDEYGYFSQTIKVGRKRSRFVLDFCVEGLDEWERSLIPTVRTAERVYHRVDELIDRAKSIASKKFLNTTNKTRENEGSKPISSETLSRKLSLFDIVVGANEIFINLNCSAFDDEHGFFVVSFGPRGGFMGIAIQ